MPASPYWFSSHQGTEVIRIVHRDAERTIVEYCNCVDPRPQVELTTQGFADLFVPSPHTDTKWLNPGSLWVPFRETVGTTFARIIGFNSHGSRLRYEVLHPGSLTTEEQMAFNFLHTYCRLWGGQTHPESPDEIPELILTDAILGWDADLDRELEEPDRPVDLHWVVGRRHKGIGIEPVCAAFADRPSAMEYATWYTETMGIPRNRLRVTKDGPTGPVVPPPQPKGPKKRKTLMQHLLGED